MSVRRDAGILGRFFYARAIGILLVALRCVQAHGWEEREQSVLTWNEFQRATVVDQDGLLTALATGRMTANTDDILAIVGESVRATRPETRARALSLLGTKIRLKDNEGTPGGLALRALAVSCQDRLSDPDAVVRGAAIRLAFGLEYPRLKTGQGISFAATDLFVRLYSQEPASQVRVQLISVLVRGQQQRALPARVSRLLAAAITDKDDRIVKAAVSAAGFARHLKAAPLLGRALESRSSDVRTEAASALARLGGPARKYLPLLRKVMEAEHDPRNRGIIASAIETIDSGTARASRGPYRNDRPLRH